jgi:hypothetical protein
MATFIPPPIQFKRSSTSGNRPSDSDILVGELAINLRDRLIYTKNDSDVIIELGGGSDIDSDIQWLRDRILDLEFEHDSDNIVNAIDHDSDILMTYHDFRSADSDIRRLLQDTIDSDIAKIYHDYRSADSDFKTEYDSDIPTIYHDFQAADSDLAASLYLEKLLDVDVVTRPPLHGQVLTWDSDSERWIPSYIQTTTEMRRETFVVAAFGTDEFTLSGTPDGDVQFARNAMILGATAAYLDSEIIVHYVAANNNNQPLRVDDRIEITYVVSNTTTIPSFIVDGGGA